MSKHNTGEVGLAPCDSAKLENSLSASPTSLASVFIYSSLLSALLEKVWALYADVNTINKISPFFARVNFKRVDLPLRAGAEIIFVGKYPPRLRWHARIEAFVENSHFVDVQVRGPFAFWRHEHIFNARGNTTEMIDRVEFSLSGRRLWNRLAAPLIKMLLYFYFQHRHRRTQASLKP